MKKPMRADPEQKYRTLYELTSDAVMLLNEQNFFDCNPATLKMFGCATREQFLGKHPSEFSPEFQPGGQTSASLSQRRIETALREGACRFEWRHCRLDGAEFPAEVWLTAMDLSGEKVLQAVVRDITEREQAEAALRESEERFRSVVESAPIGIFTVDNAFKFIYANDELCGIVDYTREEIIGRNFLEFLDEESQQIVADRYVRRQRGEDVPDRYEFNIVRKDGDKRRVEIRSTVIKDSAGNVQTVGQILDITERKRAQETLQESEQRFRTLAEAPFEGIALSEKGVFVDLNDQLASMLGYARNELIGKPLWETVAPESRELVAEAIRSGRIEPYEHFAQRKDGTTFPVEVRAGITQMADRQLRVTAIRDITERKRAEEESRAARQQLLDIIDFLPDATFVIDQDKKVIAWNRAAEEMTGTRKEDILGQGDYAYALPFWGERRPMVVDLIGMEDSEFRVKYDFVQKIGSNTLYAEVFVPGVFGGRGGYLAATASPLLDSAGNMVGAIESVRDITDRKQLDDELRATQRQLSDIIDFLPDATFVIDQDGKVIAWNRAIEEMSGTRKEDILGQGDYAYALPFWGERRPIIIDLIGVEDSELESKYAYVQRQGNTLYAEVFVPSMFGGRGADVWVMASPLLDSHGNQVGAIESIRDITERKRLERQIQESLARRGVQVQTSTEIAQEIATAPALDEIFRRVVTLIKERFGYYHAQIFRYEPALNAMLLVAGYGKAGEKMLAARHRLEMGRGVVGTAAATGQTVLATNVAQDKDWRPNPNLPDTKGELAVPIKLRDQVLGILDVQSDQVGALTAEDQLLLEGLCGQIAVAMEDTRLRQETEERLRELDTLYRATSREGWETFRQVAELPSGYLFDRTVIQPAEDLWMPEIARAAEQQALVSPAPSRVAVSKAQESQDRGAAVAPLSVRGEVVGALGVYDDPQHPMSSDDLALVESVSEQVALALESARLYEEARARAEELSTLNDIGRQLSSALSLEDLYRVVHQQVSRLFDTTSFFIGTYEAGSDHWQMAYHIEERQPAELGPRSLKAGFGSHMIKTQKPLMTNTAQEMEDFVQAQNITRIGPPAKAWLGVPLIAAGQVVGVMAVQSYSQENIYTPRDLALFSMIGNQAAIAIQNARLFEQTQARARHEQTLREITTRVRSSTDPDAVMRALVRELGTVLGRSTFVRLGSAEELSEPKAPRGQALGRIKSGQSARGNGERPGTEEDK